MHNVNGPTLFKATVLAATCLFMGGKNGVAFEKNIDQTLNIPPSKVAYSKNWTVHSFLPRRANYFLTFKNNQNSSLLGGLYNFPSTVIDT
jgi:hypothetical protein